MQGAQLKEDLELGISDGSDEGTSPALLTTGVQEQGASLRAELWVCKSDGEVL